MEITRRKRFTGVFTALAVFLAMTIQIMPVMAKAPKKESVKYVGSGKVEVEFYGKVEWKKPKVIVRDTSGKKYKASIIKYDKDGIKFKIKKYKTGKTYKFTIKGVRKAKTKAYGKVKGKVKIPAVKKTVSKSTAKKTAIDHAVKTYNIKKSTVMGFKIGKDNYNGQSVWKIHFEAKKEGNGWCNYEYKISLSNGKILFHEESYED